MELKSSFKRGKITIIASDGTLIANEFPTTIICDEYENLTLIEGLEKWKYDHRNTINDDFAL